MRETHFSAHNDENRLETPENAMTSKDFIRAEADNTDRIILYKEGLFWKAYERSAYILCHQVRPFKPTKKSLKSLDGGEIVSVGFPWKHEEKYIGALERLESGDERLTLAAASAIDPADFEKWKAELPLLAPPAKSKTETAEGREQGIPAASGVPANAEVPAGHTSPTAALAAAERIKAFNLAESTPLECMLLISELKKMIQAP